MQKENSELSICPSFSCYSSGNLAEIASNVSKEYNRATEISYGEQSSEDAVYDHDDDDVFEFSLVHSDLDDDCAVTVGDRLIFPVFNRDLQLEDNREVRDAGEASAVGASLKELFIEEREGDVPSSSSSEADELETVPPTTYCLWTPKASPGRCKKSNSTGSSMKRWRLRDLLRRSNSEGKDPFVFLMPSTINKKEEKLPEKIERRSSSDAKVAGKSKAKEIACGKKVSAHEVFYVSNRAMKEGERRRSYLPYRQDILGFFANNVGGLGLTKTFPPL